ncbi:CehA/McbA family metallohydrolase [Plantactinospora sp. DSM 117369]
MPDQRSSAPGVDSTLPAAGLGRADLHMHTNLGDGWISPARLVQTAALRQLTLIAVTDHDHVEGARRVEELLAEQNSPVRMITGVEVSTRHGHLLGLFVTKAPKPLRPVQESIDAIKEQGGLVVVPHPLGTLVPSLSRRRIDALLTAGYEIDGIEVYNPSPANSTRRAAVRSANEEWGLAEIGASDAHFWQHIGAAYTRFPGTTPDDLRRAILDRRVRAGGQEQPPARLNPAAYVAQCAWSWFVDPPRRMVRRRRESRAERRAPQG